MGNIGKIKTHISALDEILTLAEGTTFTIAPNDLSVLSAVRRTSDGDAKELLDRIIGLSGKELTVEEIVSGSETAIRLKILADCDTDTLDGLGRQVANAYDSAIERLTNVQQIYQMQLITAEPFEKEEIDKRIATSKRVLAAFQAKVDDLKVSRPAQSAPPSPEQEPDPPVPAEETGEKIVERTAEKHTVEEKEQKKLPDLISKIREKATTAIVVRREKKQAIQYAYDQAVARSMTSAKEIVATETNLKATEVLTFPDIPEFSLIKRKDRLFFGRTDHLKKMAYDNSDESLMELTAPHPSLPYFFGGEKITWLMSPDEEEAFNQYCELIHFIFGREIGRICNIAEYIAWKKRYNEIIRRQISLRQKRDEVLFASLPVAYQYVTVLKLYDYPIPAAPVEEIANNLTDGITKKYLDPLNQIQKAHVIDASIGSPVFDLIVKINGLKKRHDTEEQLNKLETELMRSKVTIGRLEEAAENGDSEAKQQYIKLAGRIEELTNQIKDANEILSSCRLPAAAW